MGKKAEKIKEFMKKKRIFVNKWDKRSRNNHNQ